MSKQIKQKEIDAQHKLINSNIIEPVYLGNNVIIKNSTIGSNVSVENNSIIESLNR